MTALKCRLVPYCVKDTAVLPEILSVSVRWAVRVDSAVHSVRGIHIWDEEK